MQTLYLCPSCQRLANEVERKEAEIQRKEAYILELQKQLAEAKPCEGAPKDQP
jgi:hypothetical protein